MPSVTLERVMENSKALTADEQRQLGETLEDWLSEQSADNEAEKGKSLMQRLTTQK